MFLNQLSRLVEWAEMRVLTSVNAEFVRLDRAEIVCFLGYALEAQNHDLRAILKFLSNFEKVC